MWLGGWAPRWAEGTGRSSHCPPSQPAPLGHSPPAPWARRLQTIGSHERKSPGHQRHLQGGGRAGLGAAFWGGGQSWGWGKATPPPFPGSAQPSWEQCGVQGLWAAAGPPGPASPSVLSQLRISELHLCSQASGVSGVWVQGRTAGGKEGDPAACRTVRGKEEAGRFLAGRASASLPAPHLQRAGNPPHCDPPELFPPTNHPAKLPINYCPGDVGAPPVRP